MTGMSSEFPLLLLTAISLAFFHTLAGPDHYLPFIVISKAKKWSLAKTGWFTVLCGLGHVGSSVIIGLTGIAFGMAVSKLVWIESWRGSIISWIFTALGMMYLVWAIYRLMRNKTHTHFHFHRDGGGHFHEHRHHEEHLHIHEKEGGASLTPWFLFTVFVFGPCEPLIPVVMYPAAKNDFRELVIVTAAFSLVTVFTMLGIVLLTSYGLKFMPVRSMERYRHVIAGGTIFACGLGMILLGL
jgi:nickel/cobalt transporter (NicO) family protein